MIILEAIMTAVCVISAIFCSIEAIITMFTIGDDDDDQA